MDNTRKTKHFQGKRGNRISFTYWHRKVERDKEYAYQIVAVNDEPHQGDPAVIVVR